MISFNHLGNLGRLANQMFQYASLKGIARNRGFEFSIAPVEFFGRNDPLVNNDYLNIYDVFNIKDTNVVSLSKNKLLMERMHHFDKELFDYCPDNVDLFGFFQSPKYFDHIKDELKIDFRFSNEVESVCSEMIDTIKGGKKVIALHIRRTDYEINPNHPLQSMEYYEVALKHFDKNNRILVFSDDPKWCQEQELFADDEIMISEGNDADIDLCLMSKCNYHIIANSSFSWWGAWLADSEHIIAPINWFAGATTHKSVKDMSFGSWMWL
tara:strand:- start:1746 stop:2549 length:804 start_codon:yes stop_codon:yes gene_type:complete